MNGDKWVMVRLRADTRQQLLDVAYGLITAHDAGTPGVHLGDTDNPRHAGLSVDDVVRMLLRQRAAHKRRRKASKRTAWARRSAAVVAELRAETERLTAPPAAPGGG